MNTPTDPAPSAAEVKERLRQKRDYDESEAHRYDAMGCPGIADRCMNDSKLYAAAIALIERGELDRERLEQTDKDINGLLEECAKHISLSNDFPWSEEVYCAFRALESEIERLKKAKHTNAANFLFAEAAKDELADLRAGKPA